MYSWKKKITPDFKSRGIAVPPPDLSGRVAPPEVAMLSAAAAPPPNYNQPSYVFPAAPVAHPTAAVRTEATVQVLPTRIPNSAFSPSMETFPTTDGPYFALRNPNENTNSYVNSINDLSGVVMIDSIDRSLKITTVNNTINIEAIPGVSSIEGLTGSIELKALSTNIVIIPDISTNSINFDVPPSVTSLNAVQGVVTLTSVNETVTITPGTNTIDLSVEQSIAGVASLNLLGGDVSITSSGQTIAITKPGGDTINLEAVGTSAEQWSTFPAISTIQAATYDISGAKDIYCQTIHGIGADFGEPKSLQILTDGHLHTTTGSLTNILTESKVLMQTTGGIRGHVILEANPGGGGFLQPGIVDLIANPAQSPDGNIGYGGTVNITANSTIGLSPELTQTSKVVISGASVLSYAGYTPPVLSTAGYNYTWGSLGVNIQSDVVPPITPNVPGTVYLFGRLGVAIGKASTLGVDYGLFTGLIQPYSDGVTRPDLIISGKFGANVVLRDVAEFVGDDCVMTNISTINGVPYVSGSQWSTYAATSAVNFANYNLANVATINGAAYPPTIPPSSPWWQTPAGGTVDMSGNSITNLVNINGAAYVSGANWSSYPAASGGTVNLDTASIINGLNAYFQSEVSVGQLAIHNTSGTVLGFIDQDTSVTGIEINSNTNISMVPGTTGFCSNTGYYTTDILTPTHTNELTSKDYVDSSITASRIPVNGNSTIINSALILTDVLVASIPGIVTVGSNGKIVGNATMTVVTNSNTIFDITYYLVIGTTVVGSVMKNSHGGVGHFTSCSITGYIGGLAAGTHTLDLVASASAAGHFTVTAVNINATANYA